MVITISGALGAGKTNVIRDLYHILNPKMITEDHVKKFYMKELGVTEEELHCKLVADNKLFLEYRKDCDDYIIYMLGETMSDFESRHVMVDSLMAYNIFYISKGSIKPINKKWVNIRLLSNNQEGTIITKDSKSGNYTSLDKIEYVMSKLTEKEIEVYKEAYNIDISDEKRYDLVLNTTPTTSKETVKTILDHLNKKFSKKYRPLIVEDLIDNETLVLRNGDTLEMEDGLLFGDEYELQNLYNYNLSSRIDRRYNVVNIIRDGKPLLKDNLKY